MREGTNKIGTFSSSGITGEWVPAWKEAGAVNCFTGKPGGVSEGAYAGLNLGLHVKDDPDKVVANRKLLAQALGTRLDRFVCCEQVHGTKIHVAKNADAGRGTTDFADVIPGCDALITNERNLYLMLFFADCIPLLFFDPVHHACGAAHGGWKGTWGEIGPKTIKAMQENFGSVPEDVQCFIGPGISSCCFEIGEDLANQVRERAGWGQFITENAAGKPVWDLKATHKESLLKCGVREENILISESCTRCGKGYFSYRRDGGVTGRMAAVIGLV